MIAAGIMTAGAAGAQAGPAAPDCAALEAWAAELDLTEQVTPVEGARATMPAVFASPGFAELFGAPALDWSSDEVGAMAAHVYDCAGEAGSREGRQAIYDLRAAMVRNLRWVVSERDKARARTEREAAQAAERRAAEAAREAEQAAERERQVETRRAQAAEKSAERRAGAARGQADRLEADLQRVLDRPDSVQLLQILSVLGDPPRDAQRLRSLRGRLDPEAGRLLAALARTDSARREAEIRPRLEAAARALEAEPETPEGMRRAAQTAAQAAELQERAEETAREAWRGRVSARLGAIGEAALPAFREELAALPDSEAGLEALGEALPAQAGLALAPEGVRDAWSEAVAARRGEIRAALEAAREAARAEAIEAGGDPELVGHVFEDETHMSRLEFRDESLAIFTVMGLRTAGDYRVSGPDVIVEGPNGTLVLRRARAGEALALEGMGLRFERAAR